MKVYKVADIINKSVVFCEKREQKYIAGILTTTRPADDFDQDYIWELEWEIKSEGKTRIIKIPLPSFISINDNLDSPLFIANNQIIFYRDRLFKPERIPRSDTEREEIILRTKKIVYNEQADLASLKAAVANLEAAIEYTKSGPKRDPISEDVKLLVWARDGGACVRCGSKEKLHFDHIIPVDKGGGNDEANIQILCQKCNLLKSDKIGSPD
jgi:hypothetical protein